MSRNLNNNPADNTFGEEPFVKSLPRNINNIRTIILQHSQRIMNNQRPLTPKRAWLNLEDNSLCRTHNIHDVYKKLDIMNGVLNAVLKNTSSEKAEATASNAVDSNWAHFVNSFGENVDSILYADYMSDLESDEEREKEKQDLSSEKSFFFGDSAQAGEAKRYSTKNYSSEWYGDRFVDELDVDYEAAHDKRNNTHPFEHKFKEIIDKQLSRTKANNLLSWSKKQ
ncbi:hypothetical protein PHYBLDRAFT_175128 [Phycomyces blakesleeanus NRRL 1555(-)]|uniref:Uncharacterized protein n=1 Tax=Phycomyces blakesleeanus (strain ATCC 8743b / DSM 1359 / FGSC 10004 / NBRC 33097 / NRRL 1555) TaxID=763407 RepID=A0A162ZGN3_PHYB8|nr:hypothetical protein PHYBLDRAFT_175128 [Phycomyces blakesleeanus NRRL 1555(-)]OAD66581.1 hypothetical protein PHYBLDRAFT_175128 [Phycomyces blakesleeanus NRRL 1555(-)]|eukprot:XP_018284621.1 hypothetical protein PHYBLDRAFT_175128 [Phycomyces blakesleeanus NRRL 1555(-)]